MDDVRLSLTDKMRGIIAEKARLNMVIASHPKENNMVG